jgi:hypothetical protein
MTDLNPKSTALVLIDLQQGIVGMPLAPHSGHDMLATARALAERFRGAAARRSCWFASPSRKISPTRRAKMPINRCRERQAPAPPAGAISLMGSPGRRTFLS